VLMGWLGSGKVEFLAPKEGIGYMKEFQSNVLSGVLEASPGNLKFSRSLYVTLSKSRQHF
jgi:hypothetical protein